MPTVCTDRFNVTGYATCCTQGTIIKQNLRKLKQTQLVFVVMSVTVISLGAGVGSLVDRAEVVDGSIGHLRNKFQVRLRR